MGDDQSYLNNVHKFFSTSCLGNLLSKYPWNRFGTWDVRGQKVGGKKMQQNPKSLC